MKLKIINFIKLFFFFKILGNSFSMWEEIYDNQQQNSNDLEKELLYSYFNKDCNNNINLQIKPGFESEQMKEIKIGEVQTELIYNENVYNSILILLIIIMKMIY